MNTNSYGHDPSLNPTPKEVAGEVGHGRVRLIIHAALHGMQHLVVQHGEAVTRYPAIHEAVPLTAEQWEKASQKAATAELSAITDGREMIKPQGSDVVNSASGGQNPEDPTGLDAAAILENIEKIRVEAGN